MTIDNIITALGAKGYKIVARIENCTILSRSSKSLLKCVIIYPDKIVVEEVIDLKPPVKVAELSIEQVEKMLSEV